ncbi:uncharacterized protein LOC110054823 [Orbicella faveolata]|uniref:uncharacterized protein LOC110054823 n=1 Tax=Orbicella faveolata TaxID=48498 RepID=UPI0009E21F36|nr:uncharacterized protein LOC110054823 [Orbicella faveolata]
MSSAMAVPSSGRPRLSGSVQQIRLRSSVFDLSNQRKSTLGFEGATNSEFAEFLLHLPTEGTLRSPRVVETDVHLDDNLSNPKYPLLSFTPVVTSKRSSTPFSSAERGRIELDHSLSAFSESSNVVTGTSSLTCMKENNSVTSIDWIQSLKCFAVDKKKVNVVTEHMAEGATPRLWRTHMG